MKSIQFNTISSFYIFLGVVPFVLSAGYNETCSQVDPIIPCDDNLGLICSDELCVCEQTSVYIDGISGCRVKANNICDNSNNPKQKCVPYSDCEIRSGDEDAKCYCKSNKSEALESGHCPKMSHEESCTESEGDAPCDNDKFLQCHPEGKICECRYKSESIFDEKEQTCTLLAGATCNSDPSAKTEKCAFSPRALCVGNTCECNTPYFEIDSDRNCTVPHGQSCDENKPCHENGYQECISSSCSCSNKDDTYFDPKNKTCYLLQGADCYPGIRKCAPNSYCDAETSRKCECEDDLHPNEIRRCALGYDSRCDVNNNLCDEFKHLECDQDKEKCTCKLASETIYNSTTEKCDLLANAPCDPFGSQKCIDESSCESSEGGPFPFQCQCIGSKEPNKNRKCYYAFNTTCDETNDKCDPDGFLTCDAQNHTCLCERTDMEYISSEKSCRILPGGSCSIIGDDTPLCGQNSLCDGTDCKCLPGFEFTGRATCLRMYGQRCSAALADCNIYKNLHCVNGTCGCEEGNIPETSVANSTQCYAGYKHLCSQEISCYSQGFLTCTAGMCDCLSPSEQKFDTVLQKCLSLPGKRCNLNAAPSDVALHCVENAVCTHDQDALYGICQCMVGYEPDWFSEQCVPYDSMSTHNISSLLFILFSLASHLFVMN